MNQDRLHRRYISEYTAGKLKSVHPIYRYIVVGIFGLVLFFLNLGEWDLWNPDEPRYAQIAREMRESGEWILPHLNGMVYAEKPPLVFWLTALSQKIFNKDSAFSNRFPSAVAALLTTLVVYWFGTRLFNERAGIFAALVLATNAEFFWLAHRVNLDTMLTLWITAAMAAMYTGLVDSRSRLIAFSAAGICTGLGFLTKLYIACAVPGLTLAAYLFASRRFEVLKDRRLWLGLILFVITVSAWLIPAFQEGGAGYLSQLLYHRTATRFLEATAHASPFYYYLKSFPENFLPWFIFFPSALILLLRSQWRKNSSVMYVLAWFVAGFIFFSLAKGKRSLYLLPLYPAASLMVGFLWDRYCAYPGSMLFKKLVRVPCYCMAGALVIASIAAPLVVQHRLDLSLNAIAPMALPLVTAASGGAAYIYRHNKRPERAFYGLTAVIVAGLLFAVLVVFPAMNARESAKLFGEKVASVAGSGDRLAFFHSDEPTFIYYTGFTGIRLIEDVPSLEQFFRSDVQTFCIVKNKKFQELKCEFSVPIAVIFSEKVHGREYVLISNRASKDQNVSPFSTEKEIAVPSISKDEVIER